MKLRKCGLCAALLVLLTGMAAADELGGLVTPESQGLSSRNVLRWIDSMDGKGKYQAFVLVRHGKTLAEGWWSPYPTNGTHLLYSLSKSFTSTGIGMLADEGQLDLDERVAEIFPDKLPANPSAKLLSLRVRDLLTMTSGHTNDSTRAVFGAADGDWVRAFMSFPVPLNPGSLFKYDTAATYMLSAIVRQKTGQPLADYLSPRLFGPLGMGTPVWDRSPCGDSIGGTGLYLPTRDMAKFGQFWLQEGTWNGERLLSREYVRLASSKQTRNGLASFEGQDVREDWNAGYGFQFWRCRHNAYRGAGAYGQFVIVMPDQDAVVAINSNASMQDTLENVWKHLLAGMKNGPLPADASSVAALRQRSAALMTPPVTGARKAVCGTFKGEKSGLSYALTERADGWSLAFSNAAWRVSLPVGYGTWGRGTAVFAAPFATGGCLVGEHAVAASGAAQPDGSFKVRLLLLQTPHAADLVLRPAPDGAMTLRIACEGVTNVVVPEERLTTR